MVPVCYATDGRAYYSPIDAKPKRTPVAGLKRVRNIRANPQVALLIDHYEEDWARLRFVMVQGRAELLDGGTEWRAARTLLEAKYPQYRALPLRPRGRSSRSSPSTSSAGAPADDRRRQAVAGRRPRSSGSHRPARSSRGRRGAHRRRGEHELPRSSPRPPALRDRGKGRTVTFSRKVFVPLTNLCRDYCGYCTFKRDPGQPGARTMTPDEVLAVCEAGARSAPRRRSSRSATSRRRASPSIASACGTAATARPWTTYLRPRAPIADETGLLPHANPG